MPDTPIHSDNMPFMKFCTIRNTGGAKYEIEITYEGQVLLESDQAISIRYSGDKWLDIALKGFLADAFWQASHNRRPR